MGVGAAMAAELLEDRALVLLVRGVIDQCGQESSVARLGSRLNLVGPNQSKTTRKYSAYAAEWQKSTKIDTKK